MRRLLIVAGFITASIAGLLAQTPQPPIAPPVAAAPRATTPQMQPSRPTPPAQAARAGAATPAPLAQASTAPAPPVAAGVVSPTAAPVASTSSWQNVNLEFTITDTFSKTPSKKTVTMLVADRGTGRIRSSMQIQVRTDVPGPPGVTMPANYSIRSIGMNIDATVTLPNVRQLELQQRGLVPPTPGKSGQIMLNLTVQYTPDMSVQSGAPTPATLDESLNVVIQDGVPTLLSQSADPQGDRKVMLEVKGTIIK